MKPRRPKITFSIHRRISSRLEEVDVLCLELRSLLVEHGLEAMRFAVELVSRECLNNAVKHGNQGCAKKKVTFSLRCGWKWMRIQVGDEGAGFDGRQARKGAPPEASSSSGRGYHILALYAERVCISERGTLVTLWLHKKLKEN